MSLHSDCQHSDSTAAAQIAKWASKPSCGKPVWPTRFIPSKTPLTEELLRQRFPHPGSCTNPHTVPRLLEHCNDHGWPVGLIINLSAQDGLYAAELPPDLPTCHVGLESKRLPSGEDVAKVIQCAAQFWQEHPDSYIAIHCAYGATTSLCTCLTRVQAASCRIAPEESYLTI